MAIYLVVYSLMGLLPILISKIVSEKNRTKWYVWMAFILLFLLFALRNPNMGVDLGYGNSTGYLASFKQLNSYSWDKIFTLDGYQNYEWGYIIFNKVIGSIWNNEQFFLAVCALVSLMPISYVIYKKSIDSVFSYIVYMGLPVFMMLFSGIRQSIAIGLSFFSLMFIEDKKWFKFILTIIIATLFHYSALIFLVAYPLYYLKLRNTGRMISLILLPVIFLLRYPLFDILSKLFKDDALAKDNGAITLLIVFCLIYVFCFLFSEKNEKTNGYLNLFYVACVCQIFGNIYMTALRVGYYFMLIAVLLIPLVIDQLHDEKRIKLVVKVIVVLAFVAFGLYSIYASSWAEAYPYYWFWEM